MKEKMKNKINREKKKKSIQVSNKKGSITLFVLFSGLFFIMFLSTVLMYGAIKRQTEEEATKQAQELYGKQEEEEAYQQYFAEGVIPIYTKEQLAKIGSDEYVVVNEMGGLRYKFATDGYYILMGDIELGGSSENRNWVPIGSPEKPFTGTLEGNGYVLYNLYNQNIGENYQGLFGHTQGATVQNIIIESGQIQGKQCCAGLIGLGENTTIENIINKAQVQVTEGISGGVIGWTNGNVIGCENYGEITSSGYINENGDTVVGGICGYSEGRIQSANNYGNVSAVYSSVGGIVGSTRAKIENCNNEGIITVTQGNLQNGALVGGIAGYAIENRINECNNYGTVEGLNGISIGGIVGAGYSIEIEACHNTANIKAKQGNSVGGIVGTMDGAALAKDGKINNCSNVGEIECFSTNYAYAAGIAGVSFRTQIAECINKGRIYSDGVFVGGITAVMEEGSVLQSYNEGEVQSAGKYGSDDATMIGGVIGYVSGTSEKIVHIQNCYNTANIHGAGRVVGGIVGFLENDAIIQSCYNAGDITSLDYEAGGITGHMETNTVTIEKCYNVGNVIAKAYVGGICGIGNGKISQSFNIGNISATGTNETNQSVVGGIAALLRQEGKVDTCYNRGSLSGDLSENCIGGICGDMEYATMSNCYSTTQNLNTPIVGINNGGSVNNCYYLGTVTSGQQRTESDMKTTTFRDLLGGTSIWKLDTENKNNGFIIFNWQ